MPDRVLFYRLNAKRDPVPCADVHEWARHFADLKHRCVDAIETRHAWISTVFLGLDYSFDGPPLLFETLVQGGALDGHRSRCSTWAEAEAMHASIVAMVNAAEHESAITLIGRARPK
jgi:hypothetical protein